MLAPVLLTRLPRTLPARMIAKRPLPDTEFSSSETLVLAEPIVPETEMASPTASMPADVGIIARRVALMPLHVICAMLVVGVALLAMFRSALRSRFDDGLSARLHALASFIKHEPEGIELVDDSVS